MLQNIHCTSDAHHTSDGCVVEQTLFMDQLIFFFKLGLIWSLFRAGCEIRLYRFLVVAVLSTKQNKVCDSGNIITLRQRILLFYFINDNR